jgi:signal recognition particle GTPase
MLKRCSKCKDELPYALFNKCKNGKFGLHNHCKSCQQKVKRAWYEKNWYSEKLKSAEYAKTDKYKESARRRYVQNKDVILERNRVRRRTPKARQLANIARSKMLKTNVSFRVGQYLRIRLRKALKNQSAQKSQKAVNLLGCTIEQLKHYLESKFSPGMSWSNYGKNGWHIDHIKPCCSFNLNDPIEQQTCFHYTNLQPLWWRDNLSKGGKF